MTRPARSAASSRKDSDLILGILYSFLEADDAAHLSSYVIHVGFDILAVEKVDELLAAWLGHYRIRQGVYDVDRACNDLATWPLIAARIAELRAERDGV